MLTHRERRRLPMGEQRAARQADGQRQPRRAAHAPLPKHGRKTRFRCAQRCASSSPSACSGKRQDQLPLTVPGVFRRASVPRPSTSCMGTTASCATLAIRAWDHGLRHLLRSGAQEILDAATGLGVETPEPAHRRVVVMGPGVHHAHPFVHVRQMQVIAPCRRSRTAARACRRVRNRGVTPPRPG